MRTDIQSGDSAWLVIYDGFVPNNTNVREELVKIHKLKLETRGDLNLKKIYFYSRIFNSWLRVNGVYFTFGWLANSYREMHLYSSANSYYNYKLIERWRLQRVDFSKLTDIQLRRILREISDNQDLMIHYRRK